MLWGLSAVLASGLSGNIAVLACGLGLLLGWALVESASRRQRAVLAALAVCLYLQGRADIVSYRSHIEHFAAWMGGWKEPVWLEGWVASYPQPGIGSTQFELATTIDGASHRISVRAAHFTIGYGDSLRLRVERPRSPHVQKPGYLLSAGLCGSVRVGRDGVQRLSGYGGSRFRRLVLWRSHDWLRRAIARGAGSRAAVSLALLLGERGTLDQGERVAFVKLGISHLLALSGQHLGFLAGALVLLIRALRCRRRAWILLALCLYVGLAGFILSLYRALVMVLILAVAAGVHRPLRPVGALASAFFLMLLAFPFALFSVGFQLSFLATLGVLVAFSRLGKPAPGAFNRAWYWTRSSIQLSVAAQIAVVPVLLACFGEISLVAPLATMVFVAPTVVLLFLAPLAAAAAAILPPAGSALFALLHHASAAFDGMLSHCARIAPGPLEAPAPDPYAYYAGLVLLVCSKRASLRLVGVVILVASWT